MGQLTGFLEKVTAIEVMDVIIAIGIIIFFRIFSSTVSYIVIRMFKFKEKSAKKIKENAFFKPLKIFFILLGFYLAIIFLQVPLGIDANVITWVTKVFRILTTLVFAKGISSSLTIKSSIVKRMKSKLNENMGDSVFQFLLKTARAIIYIIAGFIIITELGVNLNGLVAGVGLSGVIITLAAQDTAKNLLGGLVIVLDKPFIVGDWIQLNDHEGTVEDITFRSTRVRAFENCIVNIPNSIIANSSVINWSKMEKRRYRTNIRLSIDTPMEKLDVFKQKVSSMLQSRENVIDESIIVKFTDIADKGINVLICSYTNSVDYTSYLSEREDINYKIMKILREENIQLS